MLSGPTNTLDSDDHQLEDSSVQQKDSYFRMVPRGLHVVMLLVLIGAAWLPSAKFKHLKSLFSVYLVVSACILDVQLSILQGIETFFSLCFCLSEECSWLKKQFVNYALVGLWYQFSPIFVFIDQLESYLENSSEEQHRSQFGTRPVAVQSNLIKEIKHPHPISLTSSTASSFVSTPASSPQSTPLSSRINPSVHIVDETHNGDISDSDNESVGHLIVKKPSLPLVRSRTPSSSSLTSRTLLRSASIRNFAPNSTLRRRVSNSSGFSIQPVKVVSQTLGTTFSASSAPKWFRRVGKQVPPLQIQNGEVQQRRKSKVGKVASKWVGKMKGLVKGEKGKVAKKGVDVIVV
ncbi:hypothetical protein BDY24DRAFT_415718 [Mrakia frigida]|uniref:uncharacterized protein n=1 Tax=Mrakia frigida TaxID=29902 RepID=UPI003FCC0D3F